MRQCIFSVQLPPVRREQASYVVFQIFTKMFTTFKGVFHVRVPHKTLHSGQTLSRLTLQNPLEGFVRRELASLVTGHYSTVGVCRQTTAKYHTGCLKVCSPHKSSSIFSRSSPYPLFFSHMNSVPRKRCGWHLWSSESQTWPCV